MKRLNITESNKLIAQFMGGRIVNTQDYEMPHGSNSTGTLEHWEFDDYEGLDESAKRGHFHYDTDWNELMPVIVKIESLGFIVSNDQADTTVLERLAFATAFIRNYGTRSGMTKKESLYRTAVDFIDWYNSHKK